MNVHCAKKNKKNGFACADDAESLSWSDLFSYITLHHKARINLSAVSIKYCPFGQRMVLTFEM